TRPRASIAPPTSSTNVLPGACFSRCGPTCRLAAGSARSSASTSWMTTHGPHYLQAEPAAPARIQAPSSARVFEWALTRYAKQSRSTASRARSKSEHSSAQARIAAPACRRFASSLLPRPRPRPRPRAELMAGVRAMRAWRSRTARYCPERGSATLLALLVRLLRRRFRQEALLQLHCGQRLGQQEALNLIAPTHPQPFQLSGALDPFRGHYQVQARSEGEDRVRDRRIACRAVHVLHERFVDLDAVGWEPRDVGQRGIAGAEVIERNPASQLPQSLQSSAHGGGVLHQQSLGDLDFDERRRYTGRLGRRLDGSGRVPVQQLLARHVDRDGDRAAAIHPGAQLAARRARDPLAHLDD